MVRPTGTDVRDRLLSAATEIVGKGGVLSSPSDTAGYFTDWRRRYQQVALAVLLPRSVTQVSQLVLLAKDLGVAIVPQAGNTGMTGGAIPPDDRPSIILNVSKLNKIRSLDIRNNSIIAEAGVILANLREAVERADRQFPMLLGSVGSCEVGGLISTNAGGTGVLRYGNMRDLTMGLEVVLPDGRIWNGLKTLRKDNSGYDLKQMFIGAEGTLGIVTAAALKLFPLLTNSGTAMVALPSVDAAVSLLRLFSDRTGSKVEAFEIMSKGQVENVIAHAEKCQVPMELDAPWYVLIELADSSSNWDPNALFEAILAEAMERSLVLDAVIAPDTAKAQRLWEIRHSVSEANVRKGYSIANDTSVPVSRLPEFIEKVSKRLQKEIASADVFHCGHIGDGNIHVVVVLDRQVYEPLELRQKTSALANFIVHEESVELGGSISAEHGIGIMHVHELEKFKDPLDLEMMAGIKRVMDPSNVMNPGKILRAR